MTGASWPAPGQSEPSLKGWVTGLMGMLAYSVMVALWGKVAMWIAGEPDWLSWRETFGAAVGLAWVRVIDRVMFRKV